jgi:hypothetical protein
MRTAKYFGAAALALSVALGTTLAGDALKSGPQTGKRIPGPFHPLNVTGKNAGDKHCLVCEHGTNPVAMVFAREVTPALTKLIQKIDEATVKNSGKDMGSFVVFLSDKDGLADQLKKVAKEAGIKSTVLAIDNPAGPEKYDVAKDADITIVLYNKQEVAANHAFRKGEFNDAAVERIVKDIPKIVP